MEKNKVIIIGAGPGGLSAGMILAHKGFNVKILEKRSYIGGRNGSIKAEGYTFDIGPTFFLMKDVLEDIFLLCGKKLEDYVDLKLLEPMYKLQFKDRIFYPSTDHDKMVAEMERVFPGSTAGYDKYMKREQIKYDRLIPCLQVPYGKPKDFLSTRLLRALPYLDINHSLYSVLSKYFVGEDLRISFTFQAKYIGMSPWEAPGLFSIISFIEHGGGVFHVMGGLNQLSAKMAQSVTEDGGELILNSEVKNLIIENKTAIGVELANGEKLYADHIIINADFANAMTKFVEKEHRQKYTNQKLRDMKYSISTFMLYLGVDKIYDNIEHHNIIFADDYEKNVREISNKKVLPDDPSIYIQNASINDSTLAPEGKSTLYILVPVPNTTGIVDWDKEKEQFTQKVLNLLESRAGLKDLRKHIEYMKVITPQDWETKLDVYNGATFNLAHNLGQMLYWRPHNEFEEFKNCYLVGGGTHPGSGLPTIYESGRISAELVMNKK